MSEAQTDKGKFADTVVDLALRGIISGLLRIPYERRIPFMGTIVRRGIGPLAGYRRRALRHLNEIWPELSDQERARIADGVLDNFGRTFIENYSWREFGSRLGTATVTGDGLAAVAQAAERNQPVLFVTGHFGNHEAPRQVLTARGYKIGGLYRPMKNQKFNDHYAKTMTEMSGPVFAQGRKGTAGFARYLREGGMGTLLFDVAVPDGVEVDFLGKPTMTATSAADLALRLNAVMIPYFGIRQPDGLSFEVAIEAPIASTDPATMMTEATARLAARVRQNPEQWFWVHNRWKPQKARSAATISPGPGS